MVGRSRSSVSSTSSAAGSRDEVPPVEALSSFTCTSCHKRFPNRTRLRQHSASSCFQPSILPESDSSGRTTQVEEEGNCDNHHHEDGGDYHEDDGNAARWDFGYVDETERDAAELDLEHGPPSAMALSQDALEFYKWICVDGNISSGVADKILHFFHTHDVTKVSQSNLANRFTDYSVVDLYLPFSLTQIPKTFKALTYQLDKALNESKEGSAMDEILLHGDTIKELCALGVPQHLADRVRGYGVDTTQSVRRLLHAGKYFEQGNITLQGSESKFAGERVWSSPVNADVFLGEQRAVKEQHGADSMLAGLVFYADKTCRRTIGAGDFYPIYLTLANFTSEVFNERGTKVVVGFIPCLKKPDAATKARWSTCVKSIIMQCWQYHVDKLNELHTQEPLQVALKGGSVLKVCPRFLYFVGDHPELQQVCGCFGSYKSMMPCRVCKVGRQDQGNLAKETRAAIRDVGEINAIREQVQKGFFLETTADANTPDEHADPPPTRTVTINKTDQAYMLKKLSITRYSTPFYNIPFQYLPVSFFFRNGLNSV